MKGLIKKDFLNLKSYRQTFLMIAILYMFISFTSGNASFGIGLVIIYTEVIVLSTFSYDTYSNWDKYAVCLPVTRRNIVLSKYILSLILLAVGVILSFVMILAAMVLKKQNMNFTESIMVVGITSMIALLYSSVLLPVVYRFDVEKSRIIMILVFMVPFAIIYAFVKLGISMPPVYIIKFLVIASPFVIIGMFIISFFVSLRIFCKKEF